MDIYNLPGKEKVAEYKNAAPNKPIVSVCVTTYNHGKFIKQCLDSILEQQTNFDYELLLGEDDSTDKTREICKEYADKYPKKVRLFLHSRKNVIRIDGQPTGRYNFLFNFSRARGKYIALCDGDDYWTDRHKLQKQVDFMNGNKEYALCFHPVQVLGGGREEIYPAEKPKLTILELLKRNYIQTNSVMYRRQKLVDISTDIMPGDWHMHLYHAKFGKIGYLDDVMSVYRRHAGGIWASSNKTDRSEFWNKFGQSHLRMYGVLLEMYGYNLEYREAIAQNIQDAVVAILNASKDGAIKIPGVRADYLDFLSILIAQFIKSKSRDADEIHRLKKEINNKDAELSLLKNSRTWKLRDAMVKVKNRFVGKNEK